MRKQAMYWVASVAVAGVATGCSASSASDTFASVTQAQTTIPSALSSTASLGLGYKPDRQQILNVACVTGTQQQIGNVSSSLRYTHDLNLDQLLHTLSGALDIGGRISTVKLGAEADIALEHAGHELAETHHLTWVNVGHSIRFVPNTLALTPVGVTYAEDRSTVETHCGTEFINEIHRGTRFIATLKLEFYNDDDKTQIRGKLSVNEATGAFEGTGELQKLDTQLKQRTNISVVADQWGGDPTKLLGTINTSILTCTLDNPNPCYVAFQDLITYARTTFADQIDDPANYNVISYVSEAYDDSGLQQLVSTAPPGPQIVLTIDIVEPLLRQSRTDAARASNLLALGVQLTASQVETLNQIMNYAAHNTTVYSDIISHCFASPSDCESYYANHIVTVAPYDRHGLELCTRVVYRDADGDGYGDSEVHDLVCGSPAAGWTTQTGDCCDSDARVNPGAQWMLGVSNCGAAVGSTDDIYRDANCDGRTEYVGMGYTR